MYVLRPVGRKQYFFIWNTPRNSLNILMDLVTFSDPRLLYKFRNAASIHEPFLSYSNICELSSVAGSLERYTYRITSIFFTTLKDNNYLFPPICQNS